MAPFDLIILGAGAAGMMAAVAAGEGLAGTGKRIGIFEKNVQPGIKVLVCGGGRCNFTNAGTVEFLIEQFGRNGRFLTPALKHLDNEGLREFFRALGVPSHVEPGGKVYPDSNRARSVVDALVRRMREVGVEIFTGAAGTVTQVERTGGITERSGGFRISLGDGSVCEAGTLLVTVGGMSYQKMGTVGDGYRFAAGVGHGVVTPRPAIVGLLTKEEWGKGIPGLAVRDVEARVVVEGTLPKLATGKPGPSVNDMLFTHFGLSGPAILNVSEIVAELLESRESVGLKVDFARHWTHEEVHGQLRGWQQGQGKKLVRKLLASQVPEVVIQSTSPDMTWAGDEEGGTERRTLGVPTRLAEKFLELEGIAADQIAATLTSGQIHRLVERLKGCRFTVHGTRGFKEAMVTAGGVKLSEVNPNTLESKVVPGMFLAGEVLDLTGPSGGYNLQLAFSTGRLAGVTIAERLMSQEG